jgi:hypothetical protein
MSSAFPAPCFLLPLLLATSGCRPLALLVSDSGFRFKIQLATRNAQPATRPVLSIHDSPLLSFFPLLVAVSIAASGCRFWLPFGERKYFHGTIIAESEIARVERDLRI